ncbi:efflux RND transporter periplasmic adaptor subunit [Leeia sp. TBRC 13508]|uniref:Efflux RND transporter periplasmic adaptor subunit n=1 Tax=Leeia speluncae TaxID=2884804 RepID=A0ABS8D4T8_9NEIS|nr:efflux RND transporter periplasmic adaptor subunit [Leeia speluncae]MCB6183234.1 efflux RND transporter periplasmic adaptor subunit [Leeia speluncae]
MRKRYLQQSSGLLLTGAIGVLLTACGQQEGGQAGHGMGGAKPEVAVEEVKAQPLTMASELAGRTVAAEVAEIRPQVNGIIRKRLFTEGAEVKAGEPLYQIEPDSFQAAFDSAQAALAKAEATLLSAKAKSDRMSELVKINAVSKQDTDDATAAYKTALADVASNKAAVQTARINLNYTKVLSPISGKVGKSSVTTGALVTANQTTALATVQQLDPIYVDLTQTSKEWFALKQQLANGKLQAESDAKVHLKLEDGSQYPLAGKLAFKDVSVDTSTGTITLRAIFPNPKRDLLPGMFVKASLEEGVRQNGILVPQQSVTRTPTGEAVAMVVGKGNKIEQRVLKVERSMGDKWLVSSGVVVGDKVVTEGLQKIAPGAEVTIAAPAAKQPAKQ